eukprot:2383530-Amphidinium_carterae.1
MALIIGIAMWSWVIVILGERVASFEVTAVTRVLWAADVDSSTFGLRLRRCQSEIVEAQVPYSSAERSKSFYFVVSTTRGVFFRRKDGSFMDRMTACVVSARLAVHKSLLALRVRQRGHFGVLSFAHPLFDVWVLLPTKSTDRGRRLVCRAIFYPHQLDVLSILVHQLVKEAVPLVLDGPLAYFELTEHCESRSLELIHAAPHGAADWPYNQGPFALLTNNGGMCSVDVSADEDFMTRVLLERCQLQPCFAVEIKNIRRSKRCTLGADVWVTTLIFVKWRSLFCHRWSARFRQFYVCDCVATELLQVFQSGSQPVFHKHWHCTLAHLRQGTLPSEGGPCREPWAHSIWR